MNEKAQHKHTDQDQHCQRDHQGATALTINVKGGECLVDIEYALVQTDALNDPLRHAAGKSRLCHVRSPLGERVPALFRVSQRVGKDLEIGVRGGIDNIATAGIQHRDANDNGFYRL